ncbi:MAG: CdaR family protein [Dehalococcoidia bacterium]|nr:CdaR family protein [Dehalococcoidia bacterium]
MTGLADGRRAEALALARDAWRRALASIRRTPGLLLLSLMLGVSLWVFVTDTENPTVVDFFPQPVPVEAVNVGDSLAVANQLPSVTVRVSAPSDRWEQLTAANFRALVDLDGFDARSQQVPVQVEVTGISGVRVVETDPQQITVNLEDLVSKTAPVKTRVVGSLPIGYELESMTPAMTDVTVTGPASLVDRVTEAAADVPVTGLTVGLEQTVSLKPLGAGGAEIHGVRIEPATLSVDLAIIQSTILRTVPLTVEVVGTPAPGFRVSGVSTSPAAVQVQGPIQSLQQVDAIALPSANVNGARTDIVRSVAIPLPEGLSFVATERATITVTIVPVDGSVQTTAAVEVEGLGSGLAAQVQAPGVTMVLRGPLPVLNALEVDAVRATVDAQGRGPGTFNLPVLVTTPDGITADAVQPGMVTVTIVQQ